MRTAALKLGISQPAWYRKTGDSRAKRDSRPAARGLPRLLSPPIDRTRDLDRSGRAGRSSASRGITGRVEHALFVLTLGALGYLWLGALLAQVV
jgi:hypothetical protein